MHSHLFRLLCCYASLSSPSSLGLSADLSFLSAHTFFLSLLDDPHLVAYPPAPEFQRMWWKWALARLEELLQTSTADAEEEEIDARIYEHYTSLLDSPSQRTVFAAQVPQPSYLTYFLPLNAANSLGDGLDDVSVGSMLRLTMHESRTTIESGTTGLRTWPASLVLAEFLASNPELIQAKSVLELGSGVGFLGAVVCALQQQHDRKASVHLTDVNGQVLERCQENLRLPCNALRLEDVQVHELDWFDALSEHHASTISSALEEARPDVVIGADIVYDPEIVPALVATLGLALDRPTRDGQAAQAYVALTVRNEGTVQSFMERARDVLHVEELLWPRPSFLHVQTREGMASPVMILKITRNI